MSRSKKGALSGLSRTGDDYAWPDLPDPDEDAAIAPPLRLSPRTSVALAALQVALPAKIRRKIVRQKPIVVVIEIPTPDWTSPLLAALAEMFEVKLTAMAPTKAPSRFDVAETPHIRRPTFAVSSDLSWLSPVVVSAADFRLKLKLTPQVVRLALKLATGRSSKVEALDIVGLDILDVATSIRAGETAAAAVRRMRAVTLNRSSFTEDEHMPTLDELVGYGEALRIVQSIAEDARQKMGGKLESISLPSLLLHGSPGTGKTQLAGSLAKSLQLPLISTSVADWFALNSGHLGDVITSARRAFDQAAASSPCVLLIDELDALPDRSTMDSRAREWWSTVVTGILLLIDRLRAPGSGVILLGATNHVDRLDAALCRPGRFDRHVKVTSPATATELAAVLRHHLKGALGSENLEPVARLGLGATGAQAREWVRQAEGAARQDNRAVELADLATAIAPPDVRSALEIWTTALHEAGHAIVGTALGLRLISVSIIEAGVAAGMTAFAEMPDVFTRDELERRVIVGLAGRAADEILGDGPTSGAASDLLKASRLLAAARASLGFGETLVSRSSFSQAGDLLAFDLDLRNLVESDLKRLMNVAQSIVRSNEERIRRLAEMLVEQRFVAGMDLENLCASWPRGLAPKSEI